MRVSSVIGALLVFLLAAVLDYAVMWQIYSFVDGAMDGQMEILVKVGLAVLIIFITIVVPILVATQSDEQVVGTG